MMPSLAVCCMFPITGTSAFWGCCSLGYLISKAQDLYHGLKQMLVVRLINAQS